MYGVCLCVYAEPPLRGVYNKSTIDVLFKTPPIFLPSSSIFLRQYDKRVSTNRL